MSTDIVKLLVIATGIAGFVGVFYFTAKSLFHAYYVVTNVTGRHANFLGPFVLLSASHFNSKGNQHRFSLGPSLLGLAVSWGTLFTVGAVGGL